MIKKMSLPEEGRGLPRQNHSIRHSKLTPVVTIPSFNKTFKTDTNGNNTEFEEVKFFS